MIAMTTLSMAMLILFGLLLNGGVLAATVRDRHRALRDVNALMEQMAAMPIASIGTVFPHNAAIPEFNDLHCRNQRMYVIYDGTKDERPLNYRVKCTWETLNGRPGVVEVRGMRAR
jgi:hypothetical protein